MKLILSDEQKKEIRGEETIAFSSFSAFHLIVLTARVKDRRQIGLQANNHEKLTIAIDKKKLPTAATFSGGKLHDLTQTLYILTFLRGKDHRLVFTTDPRQPTATLEHLRVHRMDLSETLFLETRIQAEDGNRRPWLMFILENVPLAFITLTVTYSRRKRDSDDVKIIIDGKTQKNLWKQLKHSLWRFIGSLLPIFSSKTETETFTVNFAQSLHVIEVHADRMPSLDNIKFDFSTRPLVPPEVPTVNNPRWTDDFYDDTEIMLVARAIYGEVGGESFEAKIGVGWAIRNRVEDSRERWGDTYHAVILQPDQYEPFQNSTTRSFQKIINPPLDNVLEQQAWKDSVSATEDVVRGRRPDPTGGANHFYATTIPKPAWTEDTKFTVDIGITRFYRL